jgi:hypothetical protein
VTRESWTSKGDGRSEERIAMKTSPRAHDGGQVRRETSSRKQSSYRPGQTVRKQSAVQQPRSAQHHSKANYSSKSSGERKSVTREHGSSKRGVADVAMGRARKRTEPATRQTNSPLESDRTPDSEMGGCPIPHPALFQSSTAPAHSERISC